MTNRNIIIAFLTIFYHLATATGFYFGAGAGIASVQTTPQNEFSFASGTSGTQVTNSSASTLYWGYQYNNFLSIQAEYSNVFDTRVANSFDMNQRISAITFIPSLPLSSILPNTSIFAKIGMSYNVINYFNVSSNLTELGNSSFTYLPLYGAGINYNFPDFVIRAEFNYAPNNTVSDNGASKFTTNTQLFLWSIYYNF